jgi:hypothetical protein
MKKKHTLISFFAFIMAVLFILPLASCAGEGGGNDAPELAQGLDSGSGVIVGADGWLFMGRDSVGADDRIADYKGTTMFSDADLENIKKNLTSKRNFFLETDSEMYVAILPDKMSLYSDKLPADIDGDGVDDAVPEMSRGDQVYNYLKENSRFDIINLAPALKEAALTDNIYNKTNDSLTDYGALTISTEIIKMLNEYLTIKINPTSPELYTVTEEEVQGINLPVSAAPDAVPTENVKTYAFAGETPYTDDNLEYESISSTSINEAAKVKEKLYIRAVLYSNKDAGKFTQFMSPSFSQIGYKSGLDTDLMLLSKVNPNKVILLVHESELETLAVDLEAIAQAAESDPTVTVTPAVTASFFSNENLFAVYGATEPGAVITAIGGTDDVTFTTPDGIFVFNVPISEDTKMLYLTASMEGKKDSAIVSVELNHKYDKSDKWSVVGFEGHMHVKETVYPSNLPEPNVTSLAKRVELQYKNIKEVSPDTTLLYFIAPDHCTIYPETLPDRFRDAYISAPTSALKQLTEYFEGSDIIFLDPTEYLMGYKENEFDSTIYQKTDSHWNELGAFYGYTYLMNKIAERFPAAAPKPLSDFNVFKQSIPGGDLLNALGINLDINREVCIFVRPETFTSSLKHEKDFRMNFENIWSSELRKYEFDDREDMPTAIMYRDSFSTNLMQFMVENFRKIEFVNMWNYSIDIKEIEREQPDYVIIESVQRSIMGNTGLSKK